MPFLFIMISILAALVLEWSWAGGLALFGVPMPLAVSAIIFWLWRISFMSRIWLAILAGIFFDALSAYPSGLFVLSFCVVALIYEFLQRIFAPTSWRSSGVSMPVLAKPGFISINSIFSQVVGMGVGILVVLLLVSFGGLGAEYGTSDLLEYNFVWDTLIGILLWAIFIPFGIFGCLALGRKFKRFLV